MKCKYCHCSAGFLKRKHKECEEKHNLAIAKIPSVVSRSIIEDRQLYTSVEGQISSLRVSGYVHPDTVEILVENAILSAFRGAKQIKPDVIEPYIDSLPSNYKEAILNSTEYSEYWQRQFTSYLSTLTGSTAIGEEYIQKLQALKERNIPQLSDGLQRVFLLELSKRIDLILEDGVIDVLEEENLSDYLVATGLKETEALYQSASFERFVQSLILRDIQEGKIPDRCKVTGLPVLLGKNESLVWVHRDINGYEQKTGRRRVGRSSGVSVRVCKGVYYRVGSSKGYSIDYQYRDSLGSGLLVVTNRNLIFVGAKSIKIPLSKIISYTPYQDGIEIVKDAAIPKVYTFAGYDPWFTINAVQFLV